MRKVFIFVLVCMLTVLSTNVSSQTRRRNAAKRSASAAKAVAEKSSADIKAGAASELSWYVWPRDTTPEGQARDPAPIDLTGATIVVGNASATLSVTADTPNGIARFSWTPPARGAWTLHLMRGGAEIAASEIVLT